MAFYHKIHSSIVILHIAPSNMLDTFEIITTSGVVLWSRNYVPVGAGLINRLIKSAFIEETVHENTFKKDGQTVRWRTAKDLGLIFVV
jgi:signal recognition particle receptor subunit alpha